MLHNLNINTRVPWGLQTFLGNTPKQTSGTVLEKHQSLFGYINKSILTSKGINFNQLLKNFKNMAQQELCLEEAIQQTSVTIKEGINSERQPNGDEYLHKALYIYEKDAKMLLFC